MTFQNKTHRLCLKCQGGDLRELQDVVGREEKGDSSWNPRLSPRERVLKSSFFREQRMSSEVS